MILHILFFFMQLGMAFDTVRSGSSIIHAFPFNSEKKRGGVAVRLVRSLPNLDIPIVGKICCNF